MRRWWPGCCWSARGGGDGVLAVGLVGLSIIVASFTQACAATFQGTENMVPSALGTIAEKVTLMVLSLVVLSMGYGLLAVATIMLISAGMNLALVGGRAWRCGWLRPRWDARLAWALLAGGAPFFLWASFGVIYQRNATLQLQIETDNATVGIWGVAVQMYETLSFVPYIFQAAVLPVLARTFVHAADAMAHTSRRSLDLIVLAALPISMGVILLAPEIVALTSRLPDYTSSILPLRILGASLVPLYVDMILATILISADRQRAWALVSVSAALINPVCNWWLIQQTAAQFGNGALGAAVVTLLTEVFIFFFYIMLVPRGVLGWANLGYAGRGLAATLVMGGAIGLALPLLEGLAPGGAASRGGAAVVLLAAGVLGAGVFAGVALALRLVGAAEWRLLLKALRRGQA